MLVPAQPAQDKDNPDRGKVPARPVDDPGADTSVYTAGDMHSAALRPAPDKADKEAVEVREGRADTAAHQSRCRSPALAEEADKADSVDKADWVCPAFRPLSSVS
jgi:hypothetical protein